MQQRFAPLLIVISGCCWASAGIFIRTLNDVGLFSMEIIEIRSLFTVSMFALYMLIKDRSQFKINIKDIWCFLGTGGALVFFNFAYYKTIEVSSLSVAAILLYTAPIFVMMISVPLFAEKLTKTKLTALSMAFAGCILVSGVLQSGSGLTAQAFFIGLCSGIGYALYTIFSKYAVEKGYNSITTTFYTFLIAFILCLISTDSRNILEVIHEGGAPIVLFMMMFALINTVIPNITFLTGMKYIEAGKVAVIASIEPVVATVFGLLIFSEKPTVLGFIGMVLVVSAIIKLNLKTEEQHEDG